MYYPDSKVIWFRIPRTGTNATAAYLKKIGVNPINHTKGKVRHLLPDRIKALHPEAWESPLTLKFSVVRNPWDRLVSQYAHRFRKGEATEDFDLWLFGPDRKMSWKRIQPQVAWYPSAEKIGRFEHLEESLHEIFPQGKDIPVEYVNVSTNRDRDYRGYYTAKSKAYVNKLESRLIKDYGYEF